MNAADPTRCKDFDSSTMSDPDCRSDGGGTLPALSNPDRNVSGADLSDVAAVSQ